MRLRPKTIALYALGCKANQLETAVLGETFAAEGWQVVPYTMLGEEPPTLFVLNTCTVTEKADAEARRLIRKLKKQHASTRVAVTGCYAQVSPETLAAMPEVDFVIGNNFKSVLFDLINELDWEETVQSPSPARVWVEEFDKSRELVDVAASQAGIDRTRGSIKIQDGCDYKCTYCIIWKGRGPSKSLPVEKVTRRVQQMVQEGFKEVVLTGINIGQYMDDDVDLAGLLSHLVALPEDFRLRLTSLDPLEVTPALIQVMAESGGKIVPHLHLSTQSVDDGVLKRMARRHHAADFKRICRTFAAALPDGCIGGDIIVGFPGETDEAFEATCQAIEAVPFHYGHVFRYSPRPGTPAAEDKHPVPERIRKARAVHLTQILDRKNREYRVSLVGKTVSVLLEERTVLAAAAGGVSQTVLEGMAPQYLRVVLENPQGLALQRNQMVQVRILPEVPEETGVVRGEVLSMIWE